MAPGINTPAYIFSMNEKEKSQGSNAIKSFMYVRNKLECFVLCKPFQSCLMFKSKAWAYPNNEPFSSSTLGKTLGLAHKLKTSS